jgi:hypothetical protein
MYVVTVRMVQRRHLNYKLSSIITDFFRTDIAKHCQYIYHTATTYVYYLIRTALSSHNHQLNDSF